MHSPGKLINIGISLVIAGLLIPLLAYVTTYFILRKYTSQCTIEIVSNEKLMHPYTSPDKLDPHFVADQAQRIQSRAILLQVTDELTLVDKWSAILHAKLTRDQACDQLADMIKVAQVRNTDVVIIAATSTDKQEAADIANTIAVLYQKTRKDDLESAINNDLEELQAEVDKSRDYVDITKAGLEKIRAHENVQDPSPDEDPDSPQPHTMLPKPLPEDYMDAKREYFKAKKSYLAAQQKLAADKMGMNIEVLPSKIWDRAAPATSPSSPDVPLIMKVASAIGGVFVLCGLGFIVAGVRLKRGAVFVSI